MKVSKLDKQQKMFDLYKQLGSMFMVVTVNGNIVLDDELKAKVFTAIEPVLKRRIAKGGLLPVFEGGEAMQVDAFAKEYVDEKKEYVSAEADTTRSQDTPASLPIGDTQPFVRNKRLRSSESGDTLQDQKPS